MGIEPLIGADLFGLMGKDVVALLNVVIIDLVLAGDNAIVVGMAASRVAPKLRAQVIFWGMLGAVGLRILFALVTTQLLAIVGLTLAGGILLLWVCWKMYREVVSPDHPDPDLIGSEEGLAAESGATLGFGAALLQIIAADVSMSLDNVLAVAGAAKGNTMILVFGLVVAILAMAVAANYIAKLLARYPWITWIGLLIILYVALDMIWRGSHEVACQAYDGFWCRNDLIDLIRIKAGL
jgi:YjbE family integral membrane protein